MKLQPTPLDGPRLVEIERREDERGFFARLWCQRELQTQGIDMSVVQVSLSHNPTRGTLRGMHFQWPPSQEAKLLRCERGGIFDVIIDLRPNSPTYAKHAAFELDSMSRRALYVPSGFAHGFQTLQDDTDIVYMMSDYYRPELQDGVRYNDSAWCIDWPLPVSLIAPRDRDYADFDQQRHAKAYAKAALAAPQAD